MNRIIRGLSVSQLPEIVEQNKYVRLETPYGIHQVM